MYRCPTRFHTRPLLFHIYIWNNKDDTTLSNIIQIPALSQININNGLAKGYDWSAVNKLSLNGRKNKYVIFHAINKGIHDVIPNLEINGIPLERVKKIHFLGLQLN